MFADSTYRKYPIDSPGHIKAAWAYIHQLENAVKYTRDEVRTIKSRGSTDGEGAGGEAP